MERIYIYILLYSVLITAIAVPVIFKTGYHGDDNQNQDAAVAETDTDVKG